MLTKTELISKGTELIDMINEAMRVVEVTDNSKERIANRDARVAILVPIEDSDGYSAQHELPDFLSDEAIERIKAAIMLELDMAQDKSCELLSSLGVREPAKPVEEPAIVKPVKPVIPKAIKEAEKVKPAERQDKRGGHFAKITDEVIDKIIELAKKGIPAASIVTRLGVSESSVRKYAGDYLRRSAS